MDTPVDFSVFYYTYSTIAQTLAGAFGFLGAVVLFQMQTIESGLRTKAAQLREWTDREKLPNYQMDEWLTDKAWAEIAERISFEGTIVVREVEGGIAKHRAMNTRRSYLEDWERLKLLKSWMNRSLYLTGGTIIFCLVLMPCTQQRLISDYCWASVILGIAVVGAIMSILSYIPTVKHIIK